MQRRYDEPFWRKLFMSLAKSGGKDAKKTLDAAAYVAFRRRYNGRRGLLQGGKGLRKDSVKCSSYPGNNKKYDDEVVEIFLKKALLRVQQENWTSLSTSWQQVKHTAREAFKVFKQL